jgi:hypothetical protein
MAVPEPQLGLVISYSYLWHHEHREGNDEGRKNRPCGIVLALFLCGRGAPPIALR